MEEKQRTISQNKALHLYFRLLADELNNAGYDMRKTLKESVDIPWAEKTIKDFLWKPVQKAKLGKESTTELTTKEIDEVWEVLNRYLGDKFGIHVSFPSLESQSLEQYGKNITS